MNCGKKFNSFQASNVTREQISKSSDFALGREPDVQSTTKTTNTSLSRHFVQKFTDSLERRKKKLAEPVESVYEEIPEYSQVKIFPFFLEFCFQILQNILQFALNIKKGGGAAMWYLFEKSVLI